MPQPLTKPQFKTTTTADLFDTYEVLLAMDGAGATGSVFDPRPRVAYSPEDAVLALDEMLVGQGASIEAMLEQLGDGKLMCVLTRMLACDGRTYEHFRRAHAAYTHDHIVAKLREFMPGAKPVPVVAPRETVHQATEDEPRMQSMGMPGAAKAPEPVHPRDKPKKTFKVTTVYQGGTDSEEKMAELVKQLTPESIPKGGLVLTMGKGGPKLLKTATAHTDEDEAAGNLRASGEDDGEEQHITMALAEDLGAQDDSESILGEAVTTPVAKMAAKPAPQVRTVSEKELEARAKAAPVKAPAMSVLDAEMGDSGMDADEAAQMVDAEFAGMTDGVDLDALSPELPAEDPDHDTRLGRTHQTGGHRVQKASIQKKDRGGVRPQKVK